ncbi:MAG TPA: hypothetical protein VE959_18230 [Bryobacteraceae bacterium]|nr:hypothetical protein [Bryobacteraceae bacterium]
MPLQSFKVGNRTIKLGKQAARYDARTLQFSNYMKATAPPAPPKSEDWTKKVAQWPMMLNDNLGDCTCACAGHMIEEWTTNAQPVGYTPTDQQILTAYEAVGGYKPGDPSTDNGAVILDVLNYWRQTGIAGHPIQAFVSVEPKNHVEVQDAIYLFGNCYIGVQLPVSAQNQTVWTVPPGGPTGQGAPGSWGGHAIPIVQYDARGLTVITWGATKRMTWTFFDAYCDEAYAALSSDWIAANQNAPNNFDLTQLAADLTAIGAQPAAVKVATA